MRLDIDAIEAGLLAVRAQAAGPLPHPSPLPFDDDAVRYMLEAYGHLEALLAGGIDLMAVGNSRHLLELNACVLCGAAPSARAANARHLAATEEHFYSVDGIGRVADWYKRNRGQPVRRRAAGLYIEVVGCPQLFLEGNHRTALLIVCGVLAREGAPPFVLGPANADRFFAATASVSRLRRGSLRDLPAYFRARAALAEAMAADARGRA